MAVQDLVDGAPEPLPTAQDRSTWNRVVAAFRKATFYGSLKAVRYVAKSADGTFRLFTEGNQQTAELRDQAGKLLPALQEIWDEEIVRLEVVEIAATAASETRQGPVEVYRWDVVATLDDLVGKATALIADEKIREFTIRALQEYAPEPFLTQPSSRSGKHHPADEFAQGGKILHTMRVMQAAMWLMQMHDSTSMAYTSEEHDIVLAAAAVHDMFSSGPRGFPESFAAYDNHAYFHRETLEPISSLLSPRQWDLLLKAVEGHMGRWSSRPETAPKPWREYINPTFVEMLGQEFAEQEAWQDYRIVHVLHTADYIVSRDTVRVAVKRPSLG